MAQTKEEAVRARNTILARDPDFYRKMGKKGGSRSTPFGGFGSSKIGEDGLTGLQRARVAGVKGGTKSRRSKS